MLEIVVEISDNFRVLGSGHLKARVLLTVVIVKLHVARHANDC